MAEFDGGLGRIDNADFERIASFILSATGIKLTAAKKTMVEGRLYRRVRALGLSSISDYIAAVFDCGDCDDEVINLIDAITTNKTDFFREPAHFNFLTRVALPELAGTGHVARFWSAACSIGAEPYTLAMVLSDFACAEPEWRFSILASDISTEVLATAARAVFPEEMVEPVPVSMRQRYLLRSSNPANKLVRMAPEIRSLVRFARINLVEDRYPVERDMDVIFCRNLLIYFDRETQEAVVRQLTSHLRPGGYLILGHTDSITGMVVPLEPLGHSIFRRT
ncbi:chemotaxis protein CheR [Paramagnetospirillum caucaseum]|uniref:Chemotaxis protein methyltransferase n=1 Tax=Paramagnetospirillum caucaseum TaxID=1244869 RepID=M2ZQF9_9PROT|nr:CheR family methyltransferase [Paramagnetospirillum caucaseum]EME69557.1 chemotaxis protein CheR [Paramagnetospirillum caucaseum]